MSNRARVESLDAIRALRVALWKFQEAANLALGDAESEMHRMQGWLERDQLAFWTGQIRKRQEIVGRCKEAVRMKKLFKSPTGATQSAVDEEKALAIALRRLEEAEQKLLNVRKHTPRLQKEITLYKGQVQRFATTVGSDLQAAVAKLDNLLGTLDAYVGLAAPSEVGSAAEAAPDAGTGAGDEAGPSMARPEATEGGEQQKAEGDAAPAAGEGAGGAGERAGETEGKAG